MPAPRPRPIRPGPRLWPAVLVLVLLLGPAAPAGAQQAQWRELEPGLELAEFPPPGRMARYNIAVLRIDPARWTLVLLAAGELGQDPMTVEQWARGHGLAAAINASMYLSGDRARSTGYMRNNGYVNNPVINARFGAFLAFGPLEPGLPEVQIIDRYAQDWQGLINRYRTVVQNFRMLSAGGKNQWAPGDEAHSIACVGMDQAGRVLFIHSREPYSVHDFTEVLMELPIKVRNAMYVEGGPEAGLYVSAGGWTGRWAGSWEEGSFLADSNRSFWGVSNVLGVALRKPAP